MGIDQVGIDQVEVGREREARTKFFKVTEYSSERGPRSKRAMSRSAQSHWTTATKDGAQTERHFMCVHGMA